MCSSACLHPTGPAPHGCWGCHAAAAVDGVDEDKTVGTAGQGGMDSEPLTTLQNYYPSLDSHMEMRQNSVCSSPLILLEEMSICPNYFN